MCNRDISGIGIEKTMRQRKSDWLTGEERKRDSGGWLTDTDRFDRSKEWRREHFRNGRGRETLIETDTKRQSVCQLVRLVVPVCQVCLTFTCLSIRMFRNSQQCYQAHVSSQWRLCKKVRISVREKRCSLERNGGNENENAQRVNEWLIDTLTGLKVFLLFLL